MNDIAIDCCRDFFDFIIILAFWIWRRACEMSVEYVWVIVGRIGNKLGASSSLHMPVPIKCVYFADTRSINAVNSYEGLIIQVHR